MGDLGYVRRLLRSGLFWQECCRLREAATKLSEATADQRSVGRCRSVVGRPARQRAVLLVVRPVVELLYRLSADGLTGGDTLSFGWC
jgi:hypothetical protein